jgi:hypothetical protein
MLNQPPGAYGAIMTTIPVHPPARRVLALDAFPLEEPLPIRRDRANAVGGDTQGRPETSLSVSPCEERKPAS